ncbi:class I SAM-dependent methyltransferase [Methylobacterium sp. ID0610]|uniref:class I SAM-dependent methyltransferase n=1 Tax=Methylobacterium carpenticola TaxID=3344827 RepID=UPI0036A0A272
MLKRLRRGKPAASPDFLRTGAPAAPPSSWEEIVRGASTGLDLAAERARVSNPMRDAYFAQGDRFASKWTHYLDAYDRHLARYRGRPVRFLEIGVNHGGSLQVWRRYLGPQAVIHGLDIDPRCADVGGPDVTIHIGSQADTALLRRIVEAMGGVDVVIDDGSHRSEHQIATFETLYPLMAPDGVYAVEDVHCSYWREIGGGLRAPGAFMEYAKDLLDRLHARYVLDPDPEPRDPGFADVTDAIAFYDSLVVFERRPKGPAKAIPVGHRMLD